MKPTFLTCAAVVIAGIYVHSAVYLDAAEPVHWSFRKITRSTPPRVRQADWPRNSIDSFVLARLEKENVAPSPEADRVTLIRRVTLDLIGLVSTPQVVEM